MKLRLVYGEFHDGLEDALLTWLSATCDADPLAERWVVVPSNLVGIHIARTHARRAGGHANTRFLTLKDLARRAAGTTLPGGRVLVPRGGEELLLRRLLDGGLAKDGYFDAIADRPGLASVLTSAIRDLKEARFTPDSLASAARQADIRAAGRTDKLGELVRVWKQYEINIESGGWADDAYLMEAAVASLAEGRSTPPERVAIYGFYDLNGLQRALLAELIAATDATVFLPFADVADYDYARPTLAWLRSLSPDKEDCVGAATPHPELPLPRETLIISAPGEVREAREDLRALLRTARDRDIAFQDMAVITRSPDAYADAFRDQCSYVGLKPYVESPAPLSRTRLGKAVVHLIEAIRADLPRTELIECLALLEPDFDHGASRPLSGDWSRAAALAGITSGAKDWVPRMSRLRERLDESVGGSFALRHTHLRPAVDAILPKLETLVEAADSIPAAARINVFCRRVRDILTRLTVESPDRYRILSVLDDLHALSEIAGEMSVGRFAELLRTRLSEAGTRDERFGTGGPSVLSLMTTRGLSYPVVVVPGLVEKLFPMGRRQDPILLDSERLRLNNAVVSRPEGRERECALAVRSETISEERLLFRIAVSAARETLILSFPR
ncbi:exodeoxyribonuclease V subunit gamma, partial [bacterium]|nr:exodeoxyribonuclease V subunit gamma [bacterium]